ncbi:hypothetical protein ACHHYP_09690 [Achlya hypogyna]|uniref:FHA domain-containing protein n=1 Tax=Achlya hypogyna TaxID=1202772 RepID=A0A1V9YMP5_ACHHY|nr:hypothetical protein ACHHYP_09690 [Achlya hypogyna]
MASDEDLVMWVLDWESEGVALRLVHGEWTLGRKGNALNFPNDSSISRQHAVLKVGALEHLDRIHDRPTFTLVDSKSRFGTFVNGAQIPENVPVDLRVGDKITFGAKSTVLVVSYVRMVARISRIQKANRRRLLEGCKYIGMHVVSDPIPEITHCIMDAGNFVATEKILWALVHAHPVVSSDWIQAVLARDSLSSDLPRCEGFLPVHAADQAATPSYLLDTRRCSLYNDFIVVFLVPTSMVALLQAMGGQVLAAFCDPSAAHDADVLEALAASKRTPLVVFPGNGNELTQTADALSASAREWDSSVLRRLHALRGHAFVMHHELIASILFTRPPLYLSDDSLGALLHQAAPPEPTKHESASASQSLSSFVAPTPIDSYPAVDLPAASEATSIKAEPETLTDSKAAVFAEPEPAPKRSLWKTPQLPQLPTALPTTPPPAPSPQAMSPPPARAEDPPMVEDPPVATANVAWTSKKTHKAPVKLEDDGPVAVVVSSQLVVRRASVPADAPTVRYLPRHAESPAVPGARNFKRFKKNPVPRARTLITRYLNEMPVDQERRRAFEKQQEALEEQERVAEALFESNMHLARKRRGA